MRKPRKISADYLFNAATFYLERYAASVEGVRRVLKRRVERAVRAELAEREEGAALIEATIERLRRAGLIDDAAFAETKAVALFRQGRPPAFIRRRLAALGVSGEECERALLALDTGENAEDEAAGNFVRRRRLGHFRPPEKREEFRNKDLAAMARAGFSLSAARKALDGGED